MPTSLNKEIKMFFKKLKQNRKIRKKTNRCEKKQEKKEQYKMENEI